MNRTFLKKMMIKRNRFLIPLAACALLLIQSVQVLASSVGLSEETEVRGVVQKTFEQLRNGQYEELYDALPAASRSRVTRARFVELLRRSSGMYKLNRMDIGAVRVNGDFATAETVMFGSVERPVQAEGKIVAQQYLVREEGRWRVATGDRATVRRFLAANPAFARKFSISEPRVYVKRDNRWVDLTKTLRTATRRRAK